MNDPIRTVIRPATITKRIWIIDDEPINTQLIAAFLQTDGYQVSAFHDPATLLESLHEQARPHLILVDVYMPGMNGIELTQQIRRYYNREELPIVFLTAVEKLDDILEGFDAGGNDYLVKPITRAELQARMRVHLYLSERTQSLEEENNRRMRQMRFLLDYVSQGLLTVGSTLRVDPECSASCNRLLGGSPVGKSIASVLTNDDPDQMEWLVPMLKELFQMPDLLSFNMYSSLLPLEIERNGRILGIRTQAIPDRTGKLDRLLFVFNDFTDQRNLEDKLHEEQRLLRLVVTVLSRARDYSELIEDYQKFVQFKLPDLLLHMQEDETPETRLLREVHSFKNNFGQLNSYVLAPYLHSMEDALRVENEETLEQWHERICQLDWFGPLVDEQNRMFRALPTHHWSTHADAIPVNRETLLQLKQYIVDFLPMDQALELVREVEKLYHQPFCKLFDGLAITVEQQAEKLLKQVEPLVIEGGDWMIDLESWRDWAKSLVHITRNQIDHGIEDMESRLTKGKPAKGQLSIHIEQTASTIIVSMTDDGAGLDYAKIRSKLHEKGMLGDNFLEELSNDALHAFLFMDNFSTRDIITEYSGRGVGLAKVLDETEKIGGTIEIITKKDTGTTFRFRFALNAI